MSTHPPKKHQKSSKPIREGDLEAADTVAVKSTRNAQGRRKLVKTPLNAPAAAAETQPAAGPSSQRVEAAAETFYAHDDFAQAPEPLHDHGPTAAPRKKNVRSPIIRVYQLALTMPIDSEGIYAPIRQSGA